MSDQEVEGAFGLVPNGPQKGMHIVVCQDWEESERGWGTRPDGYTLHVSKADCDKFVKDYYAKYNNQKSVPDEYTRTSGFPRLVAIDRVTWLKLLSCGRSLWIHTPRMGPAKLDLEGVSLG